MSCRFAETSRRRRLVMALTLSAAVSAGCAPSFAEDKTMTILAHGTSGTLECEIRESKVANSVELAGFIKSSQAVAGRFHFTVTKSGTSGSSNVRQGNKFELAADKEGRVGQVTMNLEADANAVIELIVESDSGPECRARASVKP